MLGMAATRARTGEALKFSCLDIDLRAVLFPQVYSAENAKVFDQNIVSSPILVSARV